MARWDLSKLPEGRKPLPDEWFKERAQMQERIKELEVLLWAADYDAKEAEAYAGELEAKLAKAVWALKPFKILAKHHAADAPEWGPFDSVSAQVSIMYLRDAMTTLAELTGGKDE